jgi:hypothetical protein
VKLTEYGMYRPSAGADSNASRKLLVSAISAKYVAFTFYFS